MSQSVQKEIINSWSFMAFANEVVGAKHCTIQPYKNKKTGDDFKSVDLTNAKGEVTHINFSRNLGELTGQELRDQRFDLQILQFPDTTDEETGEVKKHFCLCKKGIQGEDVDLWS